MSSHSAIGPITNKGVAYNGNKTNEVVWRQDLRSEGYEFLAEYTDELVFYNERLDIYVWGIHHFGVAWCHVLTDIKLVRDED